MGIRESEKQTTVGIFTELHNLGKVVSVWVPYLRPRMANNFFLFRCTFMLTFQDIYPFMSSQKSCNWYTNKVIVSLRLVSCVLLFPHPTRYVNDMSYPKPTVTKASTAVTLIENFVLSIARISHESCLIG